MRTLGRLLIAAVIAVSWPAYAQKLDLTNMKCKQFVETETDNASVITAWLTGWYSDAKDGEVIDLMRLKETGEKLSTFCAANPNFTVAAAAEGLLGK